jgi:hypothetical protein
MEDDDRESQGLSLRNKANLLESYNSYDEDLDNIYSNTIYAPLRVDWVATKRLADVDESRKPHGKGHVKTVKFIAMDRKAPKQRRSLVESSGTYKQTTACTSTTNKLHLNIHISVKPQEEWASVHFTEDPFVPEEPRIRTKEHVRALEVYQKQELSHREIVCEHLRKLEN